MITLAAVGCKPCSAACECAANLTDQRAQLELAGGINIHAWLDVECTEARMRPETAQHTCKRGGAVEVSDVALPLHEPRGCDFR